MNSSLKRLSLLAATLTVAAVFFLPSTVLHGDEFNLLTYITVSQPFQVPGAVLQPNTKYVMRRLDGNAGTNHVVRVLNEDQTEILSTFFAVSDYRLEPTGETVLTFMETAPGYPKPVRSWFYPGRIDGLEFIYSKSERAEIAAHGPGSQRAEVQTAQVTQEEITPALVTEMPPAVEETAAVSQNTDTEVVREKPAEPEPAPVAVVEETPNEAPVMDTAQEAAPAPAPVPERTLPATGGELPLLGLIGIAALGLRQALRRY